MLQSNKKMKYCFFILIFSSLNINLRRSKESYMKKVSDIRANYILFSGFATFEELRIDCFQKYDLGKSDIFKLLVVFLPSYPIIIDSSYDTVGK